MEKSSDESENKKSQINLEGNDEEEDEEMDFRIYSILSYFIILVVIGLPIWWFTTRVYRANLPLARIENVELKHYDNTKEFGLPLSLEYDILITLVHPDPGGMDIILNAEDIDVNLQPLLKNMSTIANFIVKSQWLYLTELGTLPQKNNQNYLVLLEQHLPHIITPLETRLWSNISPRPTLNLAVYFPSCASPLQVYTNDNEKLNSNAFLSPRWGGIYIMNPDDNSCQSRKFEPDLQDIVSVFSKQIVQLFKIKDIFNLDVEDIKTRKANELLDSTRRTLKSLAQLLSEINSIVISDEVGDKINAAVEYADLGTTFLQKGDSDTGLNYAKAAFQNAEAAFSDPSLLALLYFPEDQKYAVYIPLFLPIMIPVFMSLSLVKKWRELKKKKKSE